MIADQSESQAQLRLSGLVVKKDNKLQIYNPIYRAIFNASWVKEKLDNLRPYSQAINNWLISKKDEQYLLQGETLAKIQQWAKSRKLSYLDYQFLSASQELQAHKERKKNKIFVRQASQKISRSKKIIAATVVFASAITLGLSIIAQNQRYDATVSNLNSNATQAKQTFESNQELDGLKQAIEGVNQLKALVKNQPNLATYPTSKPLQVLNEILNNIHHKNQIKLNEQGISSLTLSRDNKTIIAGGNDGTVKLWNTQNNEIKILNKLPKKITKIIVASKNKRIIFADLEGSVQISDSEGNLIDVLEAENVTSFNLSPDEKYIVTGDNQGTLTLWTQGGKLLKTWKAHQGNITSIAFSPNSKIIVSSSNDTSIALSTIGGQKTTTLTKHHSIVNNVAFSPNGKIFASGSADNTIKLWTSTGEFFKDIADNSPVNSLAFSPDGKTLISGNSDKTIKLWNVNPDSRKETGTLRDTLNGHQNIVTIVIYSPDGKSIISGDQDGIVKLWRSPSNQTQRIEVGILSRDGKTRISSQPLANITFQSLDGEIIKTLPLLDKTFITSIALSPDLDRALAGTEDGQIAQIDLSQNKKATWQLITKENDQIEDGHYQGKVIHLDFHPSGKGFVSVGIERQNNALNQKLFVIKLWNQQGNLEKIVNPGDTQAITALRFMPQGNQFIVTRTNGEIELWQGDGITKKIIYGDTSEDIQKNLTSLAISSDGQNFATASKDGTIQIRKLDGTLLISFHSKIDKIKNIYFSQDNKTILVIKSNGTISSWTIDIDTVLQRGCRWLEDYYRNYKDFPL